MDQLVSSQFFKAIRLDLQRVSRPNLLFLVLDQWRFDWNGHADGPSLPTIDALGKSGAEGNMLEPKK